MNFVIGDVHGCGIELMTLLQSLDPQHDNLIFVGDLFDRGRHGHLVWDVINKDWKGRCQCVMGNHEAKLLKWLKGEREWLSAHYYWAIKNLYDNGVTYEELYTFLANLPVCTAISCRQQEILITHAGINVEDPHDPNPSYCTYGDNEGYKSTGLAWWDRYKGKSLVIYGHSSQPDMTPRIRLNSIGLDTSAVYGGPLTAYCIETGAFFKYQSGINWQSYVHELCGKMVISSEDLRPTNSVKDVKKLNPMPGEFSRHI